MSQVSSEEAQLDYLLQKLPIGNLSLHCCSLIVVVKLNLHKSIVRSDLKEQVLNLIRVVIVHDFRDEEAIGYIASG